MKGLWTLFPGLLLTLSAIFGVRVAYNADNIGPTGLQVALWLLVLPSFWASLLFHGGLRRQQSLLSVPGGVLRLYRMRTTKLFTFTLIALLLLGVTVAVIGLLAGGGHYVELDGHYFKVAAGSQHEVSRHTYMEASAAPVRLFSGLSIVAYVVITGAFIAAFGRPLEHQQRPSAPRAKGSSAP